MVVFSQWELMLREGLAARSSTSGCRSATRGAPRQRPGQGAAGLARAIPRPTRNCRVFLSTDAGGTGLNLQSADTVVNLEVPWNPAVLEQRIARVHRMGQHRPVHVFNLVMRDSIEERVLRVVEQKRSLFEALFSGGADEIALDGMGQQAFLDTMRELFGPATPAPPSHPRHSSRPRPTSPPRRRRPWPRRESRCSRRSPRPLATPGQVTTDPRTGQPALLVPLPSVALLQRGEQALATILRVAGLPGSPKAGSP